VHLSALEGVPYFMFLQICAACWPGKIIEHMVFICSFVLIAKTKSRVKSEELLAVSDAFL
jgi:hypothetical protein